MIGNDDARAIGHGGRTINTQNTKIPIGVGAVRSDQVHDRAERRTDNVDL